MKTFYKLCVLDKHGTVNFGTDTYYFTTKDLAEKAMDKMKEDYKSRFPMFWKIYWIEEMQFLDNTEDVNTLFI